MAKLKPLDEWGVNNEVLSHALFQRFLRVVQGLESPRDRLERTQKYKGLLPYLVLGGLQGFRTCEMIRERTKDPVLEWRDFPWQKGLIVVRNEVAKQTRSRDRLRYVPLEPATIELLKPLAKTGAVIPVADSTFYRWRQKLCKEMKIRWPENCLRNSYATYAQTFRSSGDVARAMGDAESTVKRFYVRTLEPGAGKEWFDLSAKGSPSNSFDASTTAKNSNNVSDCRRERGPCSRASNCLARKVRIFCVLRPGWPSRLVPPAFFRRCSRLLAFGRASMRSY
jgi:hypothetical protein